MAEKAEAERLALEAANTDRTRVGIFDVDAETAERNRRRREEERKVEKEGTLDPRVGVFYRARDGEEKTEKGSWFGWMNWKSGEQKQVEAATTMAAGGAATMSPTKEQKETKTGV
jgi:hypothetical protein